MTRLSHDTLVIFLFVCYIEIRGDDVPKKTFENLSKEKKKKIFNAAVQEFSNARYTEASINQIIKTAEISRGSFYQYFQNKEDIYLYMITEIGKQKMEVIGRTEELNPEADFFEIYLIMFKEGLRWARTNPDYYRVGLLMELDDSQFIIKLREMAAEGMKNLIILIERDKQRGLIKPEVDSKLVVEMLYTLNMNLLMNDFKSGQEENMEKRFTDMVEIIRGGIARVKGKEPQV